MTFMELQLATLTVNQSDDLRNFTVVQSSDSIFKSKLSIVIVFIILCVVGGIILSVVQISNDFHQLMVFYKGYMGRKLFIKERKLLYKSSKIHSRLVRTVSIAKMMKCRVVNIDNIASMLP